MVERQTTDLSLTTQTQLLSLLRSSLYYRPVLPSPEEVTIKRQIDELYTAHPFSVFLPSSIVPSKRSTYSR